LLSSPVLLFFNGALNSNPFSCGLLKGIKVGFVGFKF